MFKKILIANRGEIACRIIKTAKKMNIKTVSIFSDSDRNAEHVSMADESYYIGSSDVRDSYLDQALTKGIRKIDSFTSSYNVSIIDWSFNEIDPFFNINSPEDVILAEKYIKS